MKNIQPTDYSVKFKQLKTCYIFIMSIKEELLGHHGFPA